MAYSKYYPEGWKNNESGATPITAGALNHMETGIKTAVDNMDNTGSNVVTYTSEDQADSAVTRSTGWTTVSALVSGMTHSNLFNSMSKMFKNIRWLYKMLGTTDISSISSAGTVTGAIAKLNTDKTGLFTTGNMTAMSAYQSRVDNCTVYAYRIGSMCFIHGLFRVAINNAWADMAIITGLPLPSYNTNIPLIANSGAHTIVQCYVNTAGSICVHDVLSQYTWVAISGYYQCSA